MDPLTTALLTALQEEVAAVKADQGPEVSRAVQELLTLLHAQLGGEQHLQQAIGRNIAQADRGSTATVSTGSS